MAVVAPWAIFISLKHNEFIVVNDAGGYNLWRGTHPVLIEAQSSSDPTKFQTLGQQFELAISPQESQKIQGEATSPMARSRAWRNRALNRCAEHPGACFKSLIGNLMRFWRPWLNPAAHSRSAVAVSAFCVLFILIGGGLGLFQLHGSNSWLFWTIVAWFCVATLVHSPFQTVMRFRIPITDPLLIALLPTGIARFWQSQKPAR